MDSLLLLKRIGFTEYEARAYLALSRLGPSKVSEIVKESKLPRNKTYDALQSLEIKGKVATLPVSPKKYKISDPEMIKTEIESMKEAADKLVEEMNSSKKDEFNDLFWVIKGRRPLLDRFVNTNKAASKEIFSVSDLSTYNINILKTINLAVKKGVKVRFITNYKKGHDESYKKWIETGAEIRFINLENIPRISVIDKKIARMTVGFPEVKKEEDYVTLWTESLVFSEMIRNQFLSMWKKAKQLKDIK